MLAFGSWSFLLLGVVTALAIALDVFRRPQPMAVMNVTWPITGLYMPLIGWWAYHKMGRAPTRAERDQGDHQHAHEHHHGGDKPRWQRVFVGVTHCGGGCTLGDSLAAPIVAITGFTVLGSTLLGHYVGAFIGAYLFGLAFQILPAMEMGEKNLARAFVNAVKADTVSLVAFEIGMFAWLTVAFLVILPQEPPVASATYWFMMQIAMLIGFVTSYPANWWLIRRGIKQGM